ncbi:MAG: phospho-N-acetylmuramoyl-pentapeptide-transferase [Actinobacteria bacterium]|nr:phospho-N-acetylmuramoyl-pentapeptide-transferase [Actinomycetota bacterium]
MLALLVAGSTAALVAVLGTPQLIRFLRAHGVGQPIHEAVTQHAHKAGTPTMGGLMLSAGAAVGYAAGMLVIDQRPSRTGVVLVVVVLAGGAVGAVDDWLKVRRGRNTLGLRERQKTLLILVVSAAYAASAIASPGNECTAPSIARCGPLPDIGPAGWAVFVLAIVWLTTNSVNFTDGIEGLLAGTAVPPLALLGLIGYWEFRHPQLYGVENALEIAIVMTAMAASCAGLLWWSAVPVTIFMGETGSLTIGTAIAVGALALHVELLIPILGGVFVAEGLSSFAQRSWFKATRRITGTPRRLLRMAPLHHHFEFHWADSTIVIRFWILSAIGSAVAAVIFYSDALDHLK